MSKEEVTKLLAYIKALFPQFMQNTSATEKELAIAAWHSQLREYQAYYVMAALNVFIKNYNSAFAPSVSQLINIIQKNPEFMLDKYSNNVFLKISEEKKVEISKNEYKRITN